MQRWLFVPFLLAFAFPARGQNAPAGDVAASYAVLSEVVVGGQVQGLVGSITGNINSLLGVTAEVFVGGGGMYAVLGGPRFTSRKDARVTPYAQVLIGSAGWGRRRHFALQPGGGGDFARDGRQGSESAVIISACRTPATGLPIFCGCTSES